MIPRGSGMRTRLIGLAGAVGAGGAILGRWLQRQHQAKTAKAERREEHRYTAGRAALDMLVRIRHAAANRAEDEASEAVWTAELVERSSSFDATRYLVPDEEEMRERVLRWSGASGTTRPSDKTTKKPTAGSTSHVVRQSRSSRRTSVTVRAWSTPTSEPDQAHHDARQGRASELLAPGVSRTVRS